MVAGRKGGGREVEKRRTKGKQARWRVERTKGGDGGARKIGGGEDRTKAGRFFDYSSHEGISAGISHGTGHANTRFPSNHV